MNTTLLILVYLLGVVIAAAVFLYGVRKEGIVELDDLMIGILVCMFSFVGMVFVFILRSVDFICDKFGNPVIWKRKDMKTP